MLQQTEDNFPGDGELGVSPLTCDISRYESACPREAALLALMERTGYSMIQENGQRKYGGPPPGWVGKPPPKGCEVFVGKIPRDMYEDALVPLFERAGTIYEFRLMMEFSGENRGYAFVMYTTREAAQRAIQLFDNHEVRPGKVIGVCVSLDNCRLFIGSIPKDKSKEEIMEEMSMVTDGVVDVIFYSSATDKSRNRGFAFVEYESHKAAAMARRKLIPGTFQLWGQTIQVDWAEPERDVDDDTMQHVSVVYVRNLMLDTSEETLYREFSHFKPGAVERLKKLTDYAFVHYRCREDALTALSLMNGALIDGVPVEVMLAKPVGSKERGAQGRSYRNRAYKGNNVGGCVRTEGRGAGMKGGTPPRPFSLPLLQGNPFDPRARGGATDPGRCAVPLNSGTPLTPTSLRAVKPGQLSTAVSLLESYCDRCTWSPPEYYLFSTLGQDGKLLLIYKVVIPAIHSSYMPNSLCTLLEDAKELAAQYTLWSLDATLLSRGIGGSSSCLAAAGPGPTYTSRKLPPCHPSPYPLPTYIPPNQLFADGKTHASHTVAPKGPKKKLFLTPTGNHSAPYQL